MGDIGRFLDAAHFRMGLCEEAHCMQPLPSPLACRWPRITEETEIPSVAHWPAGNRDEHLAQEPTPATISAFGDEACREAVEWDHSAPYVREKIQSLLKETHTVAELAGDSDTSPEAYRMAVSAWYEIYNDLKPYRLAPVVKPAEMKGVAAAPAPKKSRGQKKLEKRSDALMIPELVNHHQYAEGICDNKEHIGSNELARRVEMSGWTASDFFRRKFGSHAKYKQICKRGEIGVFLRVLRNEVTPRLLMEWRGQSRTDPNTLSSKDLSSDDAMLSELVRHHQYAEGTCLNMEPIDCNELARRVGVNGPTASDFFDSEFGSYAKYKQICRREEIGEFLRVLRN